MKPCSSVPLPDTEAQNRRPLIDQDRSVYLPELALHDLDMSQ